MGILIICVQTTDLYENIMLTQVKLILALKWQKKYIHLYLESVENTYASKKLVALKK